MKKLILLSLVISLSACATERERINTLVKNPQGGVEVIPPQGCPDWSVSSEVDYNNATSTNFGCSTVNNYGAMIENPEDMITGRTRSHSNAATAGGAVAAYESGSASASSTTSSGGQ